MTTVQNLTDARPDGATMGQSTSDKISFYAVTPIAQRASSVQTTLTLTATGISSGFGFSTSDQFNAFANQLAEVCACMKLLGLWKGTA